MFLRLNYNVVLSLIQRRRFFNVLVIRSFYQQYNNVLTISLQRFFIINITELLGRHLNVKWPRFYNVGKCHDTVEQHRDVKATAIQRRSYVVCLLGLTNEKHFLKTMSHQIMILVYSQNYREWSSFATFLWVHSNSEKVSNLPWRNSLISSLNGKLLVISSEIFLVEFFFFS